jgi:hypothetical protein
MGSFNIIRCAERAVLGDYSEVMRFNVLNAIPDHDCTTEPQSLLGRRARNRDHVGVWIDLPDRVTLGKNVILGSRNSSLCSNNGQETAPSMICEIKEPR